MLLLGRRPHDTTSRLNHWWLGLLLLLAQIIARNTKVARVVVPSHVTTAITVATVHHRQLAIHTTQLLLVAHSAIIMVGGWRRILTTSLATGRGQGSQRSLRVLVAALVIVPVIIVGDIINVHALLLLLS